MLDPLEIMAKAAFERQASSFKWENYPATRKHCLRDMRAAVLALAECDLPEEVTDAGFGAVQGIKQRHARLQARFRAMLRSIASTLIEDEKTRSVADAYPCSEER